MLDDRLAAVQLSARQAIAAAQRADMEQIEISVATVIGPAARAFSPDEVMAAATDAFRRLIDADTARLWLDLGGGSLELVANAGQAALDAALHASAGQGRLAELLRTGKPTRRRLDQDEMETWREVVPDLRPAETMLAAPLLLAGRPFGLLYALRYPDRAGLIEFSNVDLRAATRFVARVEPALAWSLQARNAQRVSEATQDFLRVTTHELRRPLTVLRGYVDMLDVIPEPEQPVVRERIVRAAEQLASLLSEVSEIALIEDSQRPLRLVAMRLGEIVERVVEGAVDEAEQRGCTLLVSIADEDETVQCDSHHVEHSIANLLSNAMRHTAGERRVWVGAALVGDRAWRISVRDEGKGLCGENPDRLFEKYYRSLGTVSSGAEGSGLGLYYVRLVAERHGGRIVAADSPEGGAEFTLTLPAASGGLIPWSV
jgi:signal transduction histidine kinase